MKPIHSLALLGALSIAAHGAYTEPVGYYDFDGQAGGNLFVPSLVNSAAFAGSITGSGATTLDFAASTFTGSEFDAGVTYATHYVEITSGPNAGVNIDIVSNTTAQITLADDITLLALAGDESVVVRPHVTVKSVLAGSEAGLTPFGDSVTYYFENGSFITYLWSGAGWTSTGAPPFDGNDIPVAPATGFVLNLAGAKTLTVTGEVKDTPTVVQLAGSSFVNIVGPTNPLVGTDVGLSDVGFAGLAAFADSITRYSEDGSVAIEQSYLISLAGDVTTDGATPTNDVMGSTTGVVISSPAGGSTTVSPDLP